MADVGREGEKERKRSIVFEVSGLNEHCGMIRGRRGRRQQQRSILFGEGEIAITDGELRQSIRPAPPQEHSRVIMLHHHHTIIDATLCDVWHLVGTCLHYHEQQQRNSQKTNHHHRPNSRSETISPASTEPTASTESTAEAKLSALETVTSLSMLDCIMSTDVTIAMRKCVCDSREKRYRKWTLFDIGILPSSCDRKNGCTVLLSTRLENDSTLFNLEQALQCSCDPCSSGTFRDPEYVYQRMAASFRKMCCPFVSCLHPGLSVFCRWEYVATHTFEVMHYVRGNPEDPTVTKSGYRVLHCISESIVYIQNSITPLDFLRIKEYVRLSEDSESMRAKERVKRGRGEAQFRARFAAPHNFGVVQLWTKRSYDAQLESASQNQSSDTHKTPYDQVKRCRERKNIKAFVHLIENVGLAVGNMSSSSSSSSSGTSSPLELWHSIEVWRVGDGNHGYHSPKPADQHRKSENLVHPLVALRSPTCPVNTCILDKCLRRTNMAADS
ncbi:hypothetical protein PR048_024853 [Dryococelus australis]|uniref:Uncharacterized protein n=1 Tax=Dryococelus australis TaxID=614101 RepID=A0ABQ9GPV3_9NEOP|nr:hypothetical protein PR048_024853 [Dryococelus australis]